MNQRALEVSFGFEHDADIVVTAPQIALVHRAMGLGLHQLFP